MRIFNFPIPTANCSLQFLIPCAGSTSPSLCACVNPCDQVLQFPGDPDVLYDINVTTEGFAEQKGYIGGTNDGQYFQIGGAPDSSNSNYYGFEVYTPKQFYYLNRSWHTCPDSACIITAYTKTIQIQGGTLIRLFARTVDNVEIKNFNNRSVPGVTNPVQPYNGQFMNVRFDCTGLLPWP